WKWRMQGGAVTLANQFNALAEKPDLLIISDMLDISTFRALTRTEIPIVLYFHENQLTYPQNRRQHHGWRYGFINYTSALTADTVLFNSAFHHDDFFTELPRMLKHFPDYNELDTIETIRAKSHVLPLGIDLARFDQHNTTRNSDTPLILWNHRWEADKNPAAFADALLTLASEGFDFEVAIAGRNFRQHPTEFDQLRTQLGERVIHYGYTKSFADYARLLWQADYIISPSYQDFFGIAVTEAIYCQCVPLLANRLNYPHLIPTDYHAQCLFREGALTGLLRQHLLGNLPVDTAQLRTYVTQYDWQHMITRYDDTFAILASQ
ncbi:MAG: DUF3524 domain-containing protein, partial [Chloroflexota bacterium]